MDSIITGYCRSFDAAAFFEPHRQELAIAWLQKEEIDAEPIIKRVGNIALVEHDFIWNPDTDSFDFVTGQYTALAIPIVESGKTIDLLLIYDDYSYRTVRGTPWVGRDSIRNTVRLHADVFSWLAAGCTGCCHVALISRAALKELQQAAVIECNDITVALQAWDWGFGGDDDALSKFVIDDTPETIEAYYASEVDYHAMMVMRRAA